MVNYANGKIYQVMAKHGGDVYVGSTTKEYLSQRMDGHRGQYKRWKNDKSNNVTVFGIFEKYGVENCCIVLLELVNATNIDELMARERHWIQSTPCVNKNIPGRTRAQYKVDNREQILSYDAQYRVDNREQVLAYQAQYQADNRELLNLKQSEKVQCNCGCSVRRSGMSDHRKTQKHLAKLQTKGQPSNAPISSDSHTQL
jgi:hypothetical protein